MADLIVKAAVKEALNDKNVASDFYDALDAEVEELLEDAARRAEEQRPEDGPAARPVRPTDPRFFDATPVACGSSTGYADQSFSAISSTATTNR